MIDQYIRFQVEHFHTLILHRMERLARIVDRIGNIFAVWMPIRVHPRRESGIRFRIQHFALPVYLHQGPSVLSTDMQAQMVRICFVESMTIQAHARHHGILQQGTLLERSKVTLINAHLAINFISGSQLAVYHPIIYRIRTDIHGKRAVLFPLAVFPDTYRKQKAITLILLQKLLPCILRK